MRSKFCSYKNSVQSFSLVPSCLITEYWNLALRLQKVVLLADTFLSSWIANYSKFALSSVLLGFQPYFAHGTKVASNHIHSVEKQVHIMSKVQCCECHPVNGYSKIYFQLLYKRVLIVLLKIVFNYLTLSKNWIQFWQQIYAE